MDDWSWNGIILPLDLMRRLINGHRDREVIQFVPPCVSNRYYIYIALSDRLTFPLQSQDEKIAFGINVEDC